MNRFSHLLRSASFLALTCVAGTAGAQFKVAFLAPDPPGYNPFWTQTIALMEAAAADLKIDLEIVYSKTNTYSNRKDGMALLGQKNRPDYFLTPYWPGTTEFLLAEAEQRGVYTLFFNAGTDAQDRKTIGQPRGKYRHWLGQIAPDERLAGYSLAKLLIHRAKAGSKSGDKVHIVGITGTYGKNTVTDERRNGLDQYLKTDPDAILDHFLFAEWSQTLAYTSLLDLLKPGTPVSVIWSSNDTMAIGGIQAARELNKTPGKDVFIGGFGWTKQAIESIVAGEMQVAFGGHFLEGAWALVLLYDYHNGHDFANDLGLEYKTTYKAITADNAQDYLDKISNADWQAVDFKQFSKVHNPNLKKYQWPLDSVLEQLETGEKIK